MAKRKSYKMLISIHAPRERSDAVYINKMLGDSKFQSTLLVRGATIGVNNVINLYNISIHAPRERSDFSSAKIFWTISHFNPRSS